MKTFNLSQFSKHLGKVVSNYKSYEMKASNILGEILDKKARNSIGHLQDEAGPFEEWKELADSTKKDKERLGYVFNSEYNPLYRTGELLDSIGFVFNQMLRILYLGSTSEIMIYQELGTDKIPPRSVLGMTLYKAKLLIISIYQKMMVDWICGRPLMLTAEVSK